MAEVLVSRLINDLGIKLLNTEALKSEKVQLLEKEINRPGIQFTGYFKHYDKDRIQIVGYVEWSYLEELPYEKKLKIYDEFLVPGTPFIVFCRGLLPDSVFLKIASERGILLFQTEKNTTVFMNEIIIWLNREFAECITVHGCLITVSGVGVLITGESGVGKSEAVLELVNRGSLLVADDVVDIKKIGDSTLVGQAPESIENLLECRGIGIISISTLYGVRAIKKSQEIDIVANLKHWDNQNGNTFDRLGTEEYKNILGVDIRKFDIPISPGRSPAALIEVVALKYRSGLMGLDNAYATILNRLGLERKDLN